MKPFKIRITQCNVGRYNLLSSEKSLSFYMSIYTEDNKVYEENGIKAQLHYSGEPDELYVFEDDHIMYGTGKDYIEQVKQMFTYGKNTQVYIVVDEVHKDSEYRRTHWASRPMGKYIEEIKKVLSIKELRKINNAKSILSNYV